MGLRNSPMSAVVSRLSNLNADVYYREGEEDKENGIRNFKYFKINTRAYWVPVGTRDINYGSDYTSHTDESAISFPTYKTEDIDLVAFTPIGSRGLVYLSPTNRIDYRGMTRVNGIEKNLSQMEDNVIIKLEDAGEIRTINYNIIAR